MARGVVAHGAPVAHEADVGVDGVGLVVERPRDVRKGMVGLEHVVRVEDAHHVAGRHRDALVHGVVEAVVALRYEAEVAVGPGPARRLHERERPVRRRAVHDNVLEVDPLLGEGRLERGGDGVLRVADDGDQRDLHQSNEYVCPGDGATAF